MKSVWKEAVNSAGVGISVAAGYKEANGFCLVFPAGAEDLLRRGEWFLVEATDGSGLLPMFMGPGGIKKQVRLRPDGGSFDASSLGTALSHAATQAKLAEIAEQLKRLEGKVDLVIANQRANWVGRINAAASGLAGVREASDVDAWVTHHAASAVQTASEAIGEGIAQLRVFVDSLDAIDGPSLKSSTPSREVAAELDRVRDDLYHLWIGAGVLVESHALMGHPELSDAALRKFKGELGPIVERVRPRLRHSAYDASRDMFWKSSPLALPVNSLREVSLVLTMEMGEPVITEGTSNV